MKPVSGLFLGKARYGKFSDRTEIAAAIFGEFLRRQNSAAEPAGKLFQARRQIYRRADTSKVEAIAAADIAVEHVTQMQREAETHAGVAVGCRLQLGDFGPRHKRCLERRGADRGGIAFGDLSEKSPASRRP